MLYKQYKNIMNKHRNTIRKIIASKAAFGWASAVIGINPISVGACGLKGAVSKAEYFFIFNKFNHQPTGWVKI